MTDRTLKRLIADLEKLDKAWDLTVDGWMWLRSLKLKRAHREEQPRTKRKAKQ